MLANGQAEAGKNSYHPALTVNENASVDLFFGPEPPAGGTSNWIRTLPGKGWFTILRLYGPLEGYMEKTWKPGDIEPA